MVLNHRLVLRMATDLAIGLFLVFSFGVVLWVADEFLGWNVLPDWIDKFAQLLVVVFGIAGGLAVGTSLLCSFVVIAESVAEHVGIREPAVTGRRWRMVGLVFVGTVGAFVLFGKIDAYRKGLIRERQKSEAKADFDQKARDLQSNAVQVAALVDDALLNYLTSGAQGGGDAELIRYMSAVRVSIPHRPVVSVLVRAALPYQYCHLELVRRPEREANTTLEPYALTRQLYLGFPTAQETSVVERLFADQAAPLTNLLRGEVIDNGRSSGWQTLRRQGEVVGLLLLKAEDRPPFEFHHSGPVGLP